jgi:hypothetical protein
VQDTAQHFEATSSVDQLAEITTKVCDELQRKIESGLSEQKELLNNLHTSTQTRLEQVTWIYFWVIAARCLWVA